METSSQGTLWFLPLLWTSFFLANLVLLVQRMGGFGAWRDWAFLFQPWFWSSKTRTAADPHHKQVICLLLPLKWKPRFWAFFFVWVCFFILPAAAWGGVWRAGRCPCAVEENEVGCDTCLGVLCCSVSARKASCLLSPIHLLFHLTPCKHFLWYLWAPLWSFVFKNSRARKAVWLSCTLWMKYVLFLKQKQRFKQVN